jgi:DNA (cytosine-5)-methyltransferase 1
VGENVLGLVSWSGGLVFEEVQADLEAEGYEIQPFVLPAAAVNAPHRRDRIWFVAYSKLYANGLRTKGGMDMGGELLERREREQKANGFDNNSQNEFTPNTHSNGQHKRHGLDEINTGEGGVNALSDTNESNGDGDVANSNGIGLRHESNRAGESRFAGKIEPGDYWQNFPTVSPIRFGNDGISDRLDSITFSKWRNESIKAAGNAIVPQVVYEIFKAIEKYENKFG